MYIGDAAAVYVTSAAGRAGRAAARARACYVIQYAAAACHTHPPAAGKRRRLAPGAAPPPPPPAGRAALEAGCAALHAALQQQAGAGQCSLALAPPEVPEAPGVVGAQELPGMQLTSACLAAEGARGGTLYL